jgi:hypothetical protein
MTVEASLGSRQASPVIDADVVLETATGRALARST